MEFYDTISSKFITLVIIMTTNAIPAHRISQSMQSPSERANLLSLVDIKKNILHEHFVSSLNEAQEPSIKYNISCANAVEWVSRFFSDWVRYEKSLHTERECTAKLCANTCFNVKVALKIEQALDDQYFEFRQKVEIPRDGVRWSSSSSLGGIYGGIYGVYKKPLTHSGKATIVVNTLFVHLFLDATKRPPPSSWTQIFSICYPSSIAACEKKICQLYLDSYIQSIKSKAGNYNSIIELISTCESVLRTLSNKNEYKEYIEKRFVKEMQDSNEKEIVEELYSQFKILESWALMPYYTNSYYREAYTRWQEVTSHAKKNE